MDPGEPGLQLSATPYVDFFTEILKSRNPGRRVPVHRTKLWILAHRFEELRGGVPPFAICDLESRGVIGIWRTVSIRDNGDVTDCFGD
jgi:hypothetical protein